jgi:hypothetical protein
MSESKPRLRRRTDGRLDRSRDASILSAALAALAEHGYEATNTNDVAAQAGVAPPSTSIDTARAIGRSSDRPLGPSKDLVQASGGRLASFARAEPMRGE